MLNLHLFILGYPQITELEMVRVRLYVICNKIYNKCRVYFLASFVKTNFPVGKLHTLQSSACNKIREVQERDCEQNRGAE